MISREWRIGLASMSGTSHIKLGTPCQDASYCKVLLTKDKEPILVAVASDGAGSAKRAEAGSRFTCSNLIHDIESFFHDENGKVSGIDQVFAKLWLKRIQGAIQQIAEEQGLTRRDFACTILAAVIGVEDAAFFQVGDGAMVVLNELNKEYDYVFWPQKGEFENSTNFITDTFAYEQLNYAYIHEPISEIAVFTDGLQMIALHYGSRKAYTPFFSPIFDHLRKLPADSLDDYSESLRAFLDSKQVNERTDDDKTLILASRLNA